MTDLTPAQQKRYRKSLAKLARTQPRNDWATRSGSYNGARSLYQQGMQYVTYYVWLSIRGFSPAGNDPITGRPKSDGNYQDRELGRQMHKAAARMYLAKARAVRASMGVA